MDPVVLSYMDSLLRQSDLALLEPPNWLNDHIIGFAFEYFASDQFQEFSDQVCFISPEVAQFIKCALSQEEIAIFLQPLDLLHKKLVFLPINDNSNQAAGGTHWSLLVYFRDKKCFAHYDSHRILQGPPGVFAAAPHPLLCHAEKSRLESPHHQARPEVMLVPTTASPVCHHHPQCLREVPRCRIFPKEECNPSSTATTRSALLPKP
uniref:SUMO peptidase family member, NEDD8 specific n=1 Tax=Anas zonorhyncha TaxID=75864 RepID=A0A8B9UB62_9AVES